MPNVINVGIVGGGGWLGRAFADALLDTGVCAPSTLALSGRGPRDGPAVSDAGWWTRDNQALADRSDVIVVAVRPEQFDAVRIRAPERLIVSVMAGVSIERLIEHTGSRRIVRVMPNACATVRLSYSPWVGSPAATGSDKATVDRLLAAVGTSEEIAKESDLDYLTGLSGSGPAIPAMLAASMISDAVAKGLPAGLARRAVCAVFAGAGRMLSEPEADPGRIAGEFLAYRGTTAAALRHMTDSGLDRIVSESLSEAARHASSTMS